MGVYSDSSQEGEEKKTSDHLQHQHLENVAVSSSPPLPTIEAQDKHTNGEIAVVIDSIEETPTGKFTWLVASTASIGGMLFGYDTGIISAVLVYLRDDLSPSGSEQPLSSNQKELITSLCSVGALIGAIVAGLTADRYGRKGAIYAGCFLFTAGAVIQAAAFSLVQMALGRLVVGLGVGSASMIVPLYLAEIAPTRFRGRMVGLNNASITGGQVISYGIGQAFSTVPHGWRYMVGLGGVPSIILACLLPFCPESPRQLVFHGRREEAKGVIGRIFKNATPEQVEDKLDRIEMGVQSAKETLEGRSRWAAVKRMHTDPANLRALICACTLMVISQISGFNTLMYYSATLFSLVGFSNPVAVGLVVAGTNFVMTWINALLVDPYGRRRVLVCTVWAMSLSLMGVAVAFHFIPVDLETLELETGGELTTPAVVVLVFIVLFCICYGLSVGNISWMSTDFFPMEVRAMGTMWMSCCNWVPNLIVSSTFLTMMKSMTPSGAFGFYSCICGVGWVLIIFFYPEVSGLTLEEVNQVFKHGFGVKYARELRRARKQAASL